MNANWAETAYHAAIKVTIQQLTAKIRVTTSFRLRVRAQGCSLQALGGNFL